MGAKNQTKVGLEPCRPDSNLPRQLHYSLGYRFISLFRSASNNSKIKKCVEKSLEKSKIILEEKRKNVQAKNLHRNIAGRYRKRLEESCNIITNLTLHKARRIKEKKYRRNFRHCFKKMRTQLLVYGPG